VKKRNKWRAGAPAAVKREKNQSRKPKALPAKRAGRKKLLRQAGTILVNGVIFKNPVVIGALGLFPVVAAGYSMENAWALSLLMLVMMTPVCLISGWLGEKVPVWVRPALVLLLSALFYLPASRLLDVVMPGASLGLGIYGPLMIANSIILSRANDYAPNHLTPAVLADSLGCTAGFCAVLLIVSALRAGWAHSLSRLGNTALQNPASYPFAGLILLGFLSALIQFVNHKRPAEGKVTP